MTEDGRTALHYELHGDPDAPPVLLLARWARTCTCGTPDPRTLGAPSCDRRRPSRPRRIPGPDRAVHDRGPRRRRRRAPRHTRDRRRALRGPVPRRRGRTVAGSTPPAAPAHADRAVHGSAVRARAAVAGPGGGRPRRRRRLHRGRRGRTLVHSRTGAAGSGTGGPPRRDGARHHRRGLRGLLRGARALGRPARPGAHRRTHTGDRCGTGRPHSPCSAAGDRGRYRGRRVPRRVARCTPRERRAGRHRDAVDRPPHRGRHSGRGRPTSDSRRRNVGTPIGSRRRACGPRDREQHRVHGTVPGLHHPHGVGRHLGTRGPRPPHPASADARDPHGRR